MFLLVKRFTEWKKQKSKEIDCYYAHKKSHYWYIMSIIEIPTDAPGVFKRKYFLKCSSCGVEKKVSHTSRHYAIALDNNKTRAYRRNKEKLDKNSLI